MEQQTTLAAGYKLSGPSREYFDRVVEMLRAEENLDPSDPEVGERLSELALLLASRERGDVQR